MLDILISTYNRNLHVLDLVNQILDSGFNPSNIIVVDSSEDVSLELQSNDKVLYLRSSFKAQPYQRYVALLASTSDFVMFLDDDLEVLNKNVFQEVLDTFMTTPDIVGVTARVNYESGLYVQAGIKTISRFLGPLQSFVSKFTLNNTPSIGKLSIMGNGGGYTNENEYMQYFPGPNMSFRRKVALELFDETLFTSYVNKIGKGEDKYLSMKANQFGKLYCLGKRNHFFHPPIESSYNSSLVDFQTKQTYSRFLLVNQYMKTFFGSSIMSVPVFFWYTSFRIIGSLNNYSRLLGTFRGTRLVIIGQRKYPNGYFFKQAKLDSKDRA